MPGRHTEKPQRAQLQMRIFYDHQAFSLQDAGGVSRYQYELVRNLQGTTHVQLAVLMGLNSSVLPFQDLRNAQTRILSWKTGLKPGYFRYAINEMMSTVRAQSLGQFDIYHVMLYRAIPFVHRRRLVVTHHDCTHERFPNLFHNASFIMERKRKLFAQADAIICVSHSSRRDLHHFYDVNEAKTHVVHHGFSPPQLGSTRAEVTGESRVPYLLYVGSRSEYKNFQLLLEAFSRSGLVADYRLVVIGGGEFSAQEQARIDSLGLASRISIVPKADDVALAHAYRNAALFVYPSLCEGFGFPPLEAMSLNCPVLVFRTSSLPEVCGDAAFYFEAPDADELSRALVSTLQDVQGIATRRKLGEQRTRLYDWSGAAAETLEIYRALIDG
jgi:glycosyltransferase involved in cell wall biosynthesis